MCEALEQTVAQLRQRLQVEEVKGMSEGMLRSQLAALQDEVKVVLLPLMLCCRKSPGHDTGQQHMCLEAVCGCLD